MAENNRIIVIGSINMDIVLKVPRIPERGETILGNEILVTPGGKGANQAISASQAGSRTYMLGKVGRDSYGTKALENLKKQGVLTESIIQDEMKHTGLAIVTVAEDSSNSIIVIPGANGDLQLRDIEKSKEIFNHVDGVLLQMEIPLETIFYSIEIAAEKKRLVILDPAPAAEIPDRIYKKISVITPNVNEAEQLSQINIKEREDFERAACFFIDKGVKIVLLTLGEQGVYVKSADSSFKVEGIRVRPLDTTGAGDCFTGVFASLYRGDNLKKAVEEANMAAAYSTTIRGAQTPIPPMESIKKIKKDSIIN